MSNRFDHVSDELSGYLELGMAEDVLATAKKILRSGKIYSWNYCEALDAILIQADDLKTWRRRVERAYERLDKTGKRLAAERMLDFYVSISAWNEACAFLPRKTNDPHVLLFSMWTLLELQKTDEAAPIYRKCLRRLKTARNEMEASCFFEAIAAYSAQIGEWERAEAAWEYGQECPAFAENAWDGLTKLHAYRGLLQANVAFETAKRTDFWDEPGLMLPNNSCERCELIDKKFHRYAKHLAKVIPAKERWRFGR